MKFTWRRNWVKVSIAPLCQQVFNIYNALPRNRCEICGYIGADFCIERTSLTSGNRYDQIICRVCANGIFKAQRGRRNRKRDRKRTRGGAKNADT